MVQWCRRGRRCGTLTPGARRRLGRRWIGGMRDRKSTRLNSSHLVISYAVFCLKKKKTNSVVMVTFVNASFPTFLFREAHVGSLVYRAISRLADLALSCCGIQSSVPDYTSCTPN